MDTTTSPQTHRRAARVLGGFFLVYALLVSTHLGEFWPFSIYPMFSSAGQPWTRSLVHQIPDDVPDDVLWSARPPDDLPGTVLPLNRHGIFQNDLANYVSKTREWTPGRLHGIESMFRGRIEQDQRVMIYSVTGRLEPSGVGVTATPLILLRGQQAEMAPISRAEVSNE